MTPLRFRAWYKIKQQMAEHGDVCAALMIAAHDNNDPAIANYVLMQSTGLTDKNGKEIFEGDVVRIRQQGASQKAHQVLYAREIASFVMSRNESGIPSVGIGGYFLEIIGDIYSNPSLLSK